MNRLLTVREPWASAIIYGEKDVENRSQGFPKKFRGPLWIHTSKSYSERGRRDERILETFPKGTRRGYAVRHVPAYGGIAPWPFLSGFVIGLVDVVDIHPASGCCAPWGEETYPPANPEGRPPGTVTHLRLENRRDLGRPIPARGALGIWRADADLDFELELALETLR